MSEIMHAATIATTRLLAAGKAPPDVAALLARIEELERDANQESLETARLHRIEEAATDAFEYHRLGRTDADAWSEFWDADTMLSKLDELGDALATPTPKGEQHG